MITNYRRYDKRHKRTITMHVDVNGMQHRHNSVPLDGIIPQHVHFNNPHTSYILNGLFDLDLVSPKGVASTREVKKGDEIVVEVGWQHTFRPKEVPTGWIRRWVVDCVYPEGVIL